MFLRNTLCLALCFFLLQAEIVWGSRQSNDQEGVITQKKPVIEKIKEAEEKLEAAVEEADKCIGVSCGVGGKAARKVVSCIAGICYVCVSGVCKFLYEASGLAKIVKRIKKNRVQENKLTKLHHPTFGGILDEGKQILIFSSQDVVGLKKIWETELKQKKRLTATELKKLQTQGFQEYLTAIVQIKLDQFCKNIKAEEAYKKHIDIQFDQLSESEGTVEKAFALNADGTYTREAEPMPYAGEKHIFLPSKNIKCTASELSRSGQREKDLEALINTSKRKGETNSGDANSENQSNRPSAPAL